MNDEAQVDVLLVTVTKVETAAVLSAFGMLERSKPISIEGRVYFDLGVVNGARVGLTRSEMGTEGLGASLHTVHKGIEALAPAAVIMVGIAFGIDDEKQRIGDVLVAKQLRMYELQRVGTAKDGRADIISRSERPHASTRLLNLLKSAEVTFRGAPVHIGTILSGSKLVDHIDFREQLCALEPEAIGGEMEGAGLYVACHEAKVDWIMVKAICDFADGRKAEEQEKRQALAARNAAAFVYHALCFAPVAWSEHRPAQSSRSKQPKPRRWTRTSVVALAVLLALSGVAFARFRVKYAPVETGYPLKHAAPIDWRCTEPAVLLATTPLANKKTYHWPITQQTFRANRQFLIVPGEPRHEKEVHLAPYHYDDIAYALVATCFDPATCNEVAGMYKAIVRSSVPQPFCGKHPHLGEKLDVPFSWSPEFNANLPQPEDARALCARLNACMIATDRGVEGDPFIECQKAPHKFKTSCALHDPCEEVLSCLEPATAVLRSWGLAR